MLDDQADSVVARVFDPVVLAVVARVVVANTDSDLDND